MKVLEFDISDQNGFNAMRDLQRSLYSDEFYLAQIGNINPDGFVRGFLTFKDAGPSASSIIYQPSVSIEGSPILFFGYFEALDLESGITLMDHIKSHCIENFPGHQLIGPVNSSTWSNYKIPLNQFEALFPGDVSGKPWYPVILEKTGFDVFCRYNTNIQTQLNFSESNTTGDFHIAYFDKEEIKNRLLEIYDITIEAFKTAPLFQPLNFDVFKNKYSQDLERLDTSMMPFACDGKGDIIAYLVAYPAYESHAMVIKTLARKSGRSYAGAGKFLSNEIVNVAISRNYDKIYHAFMNQMNVSNVLSKDISGACYKSYQVYSLNIQ